MNITRSTLFPARAHRASFSKVHPLIVSLMLLTGLLGKAEAALLAYDGFGVGPGGYTDGADIQGQGHGTGWAGTWISNSDNDTLYTTVNGSIAPATVMAEDGMVRFGGTNKTIDLGRQYTTTFGGDTPVISEAWSSFAFERNQTREFVVNPFDTTNSAASGQFMGIFAANGSNDLVARIRFGTSIDIEVSASSFSMTTGTDYFVVTQALFNPSGVEDVLNVWVFAADDYDGILSAQPTMTVAYDLDSEFSFWTARNQNPLNNPVAVNYDEFRLGETFNDVSALIPEPGTWALLLGSVLGICVVVGRRKRLPSQ